MALIGAYNNSYEEVKNYLNKQSEKIDIVFDIHRDSYAGNENDINLVKIDSNDAARLRFVIAIGHENWENNLKWAIKIQKKANELYPGLFKPMYIYTEKYNQDISKYATLIEVGNDNNTIEEAENSMTYLSNVLEKCINDL